MNKRWSHKQVSCKEAFLSFKREMDEACAQKSVDPIPEALLNVLFQRGIRNYETAQQFFRPSLAHLHSPFLMKDMEKAVARIEQAMRQREKILIYGDYDVDGTTAVALVYGFLRKYHSLIDFYIPDRYNEGYGVSKQGIDFAKEQGFSLVISLDCGIKSVDKIAYAKELGIDFIVCDHHLPDEDLPDAVAVLDPKRSDCDYPYKELSGCGVGFKLMQAFAESNSIHFSELERYLDLVAISIASDIVHLTGENRVLAYFGLLKLNTSPSIGIKSLMEVSGKTDNYTISDIVFVLGPRINAAGRIDDAKNSVRLMIAENEQVANECSILINSKNSERKEFDMSITEEALAMIENDVELQKKKTTVLFSDDWHKGVIGIVASRLTEKYYRPTVILTESNGSLSGSARSVVGFDLYDALNDCKHLLEQFGGHKYAAGLTLKPENLQAFQSQFEEVVSRKITDEMLVQEVQIDNTISLSEITGKFCRLLKLFAPFGPENMAPVFSTQNLTAIGGSVSVVGKKHLKFKVRESNSAIFDCIAFGFGDYYQSLSQGVRFHICYTIEENIWKDRKTTQLNVKSIRLE